MHKTLKKALDPANIISFPSKNYGKSVKQKDKIAIESRKEKLESYLTTLLNDPAYLCKEILNFIECDADLTQIYSLFPAVTYRITEEMSWEGDISDDCTHYILYHANIAKAFGNSNFEIE